MSLKNRKNASLCSVLVDTPIWINFLCADLTEKESSDRGTSLKSQIKIITVLSPLCPADTSRQIWLMKLAASRKNGASFISDDSGGAPASCTS